MPTRMGRGSRGRTAGATRRPGPARASPGRCIGAVRATAGLLGGALALGLGASAAHAAPGPHPPPRPAVAVPVGRTFGPERIGGPPPISPPHVPTPSLPRLPALPPVVVGHPRTAPAPPPGAPPPGAPSRAGPRSPVIPVAHGPAPAPPPSTSPSRPSAASRTAPAAAIPRARAGGRRSRSSADTPTVQEEAAVSAPGAPLALGSAQELALPLLVAGAVLAFLIVQGRIDSRDPRLVDAPIRRESLVPFA